MTNCESAVGFDRKIKNQKTLSSWKRGVGAKTKAGPTTTQKTK